MLVVVVEGVEPAAAEEPAAAAAEGVELAAAVESSLMTLAPVAAESGSGMQYSQISLPEPAWELACCGNHEPGIAESAPGILLRVEQLVAAMSGRRGYWQ